MKETLGRVFLVGAGCGDAELITCRGLSLLRRCEVVVYDDLIAADLLSAVPERAEKLYMGKRGGKRSASQEEICAVLIARARAGKTVVRLKGGDPFVFGRGGEELQALRAADIPCEEIPGISSAIAIPAAAGIPVTHRGQSQSVHIVTAHTAESADGLPADFDALARLSGTLVFLMGLGQLEKICGRLMAAGMAADTPAAVASGGHAAVRGTLKTLAARTRVARVNPPAVIVVGAVAALRLTSTVERPLDGCCVGLTGTPAVAEKLGLALRERGARVFPAQRSIVTECPLEFDLRTLCDGRPVWLVFTSGNGVRVFFTQMLRRGIDIRRLHACRFAAIGAATEAALGAYGMRADLCPETFTSDDLARALLKAAEPKDEFFLLRSRQGSPTLFRMLAEQHATRDIALYDLRGDGSVAERARPRLRTMDYLTFSSAGGVDLFFDAHGAVPERAVCVCIGDATAKALRRRYTKPFLTAPEISAQGLLEAILRHWRERRSAFDKPTEGRALYGTDPHI